MIFYTVKGPRFSLEIHNEKLRLVRRSWSIFIPKTPEVTEWALEKLSSFNMTKPHHLKLGKLNWQSADGKTGSFRFTTNSEMVKRIERYIQERIAKVEERKNFVAPAVFLSSLELKEVQFKTIVPKQALPSKTIKENTLKIRSQKASKRVKKHRKRAA